MSVPGNDTRKRTPNPPETRGRGRRPRRPGRGLIIPGALALFGVSGYELWIRLEDFWAWTRGVRHLSAVRGTPFLQDLAIIFEAPEMRQLGYKMLFLCFCILFGLICLWRRNRARGAWVLIALDLILCAAGGMLGLYTLRPSDWAQTLKLLPLLLILVGLVSNIVHRAIRRRRRARRAAGS